MAATAQRCVRLNAGLGGGGGGVVAAIGGAALRVQRGDGAGASRASADLGLRNAASRRCAISARF